MAQDLASDYLREPAPKLGATLGLLIATLLIHALFFLGAELLRTWGARLTPSTPVELTEIDPALVQKIKDAWKKEAPIILSRDDRNAVEDAPNEARYASDRNRRVERETRARKTDVLPKPGVEKRVESPGQKNLSALGFGRLAREFPHSAQDQAVHEGADQALLDSKLSEGSENLLNTRESVYYSFYSRMYQAIAPVWQSRIRGLDIPHRRIPSGAYITAVDVVLDTDGNLVAIQRLQASGIDAFDMAVDESLKKVARFPNPPKGLIHQDGFVHTTWTFAVKTSQESGFQFFPPSRVGD